MATPPKKSLGRGLGSLIGGGVAKPAAPAPTFTPLKLVPLTGTKPAETAPAAPEKK